MSLDAIKRRLQLNNKYLQGRILEDNRPPLFKADIILAIPNVVMKPSLDDIQSSLNKSVQVGVPTRCLSHHHHHHVPKPWGHWGDAMFMTTRLQTDRFSAKRSSSSTLRPVQFLMSSIQILLVGALVPLFLQQYPAGWCLPGYP